jgi:hypothetical protein
MWVVKIDEIDASCHTSENDALVQKQRFIDDNVSESDLSIVEQDTYNPPLQN